MKKTINFERIFAPRWWNPLFWLFVLLAPVFGIIAGGVCGLFCGVLIGLEKCLDSASGKLRQFNAKLP